MTRDEARDMAALMLAYADGKTVQIRIDKRWVDMSDMSFQSPPSYYRIKPEPKDIWVNEYKKIFSRPHMSKEDAERTAHSEATRIAVHYREVCDE